MAKSSFSIAGITLCSLMIGSCSTQELSHVEIALGLAGENRAELEKVLNHYSDDSLKFKAAEFLIANMPGHNSYRDHDGERAFYNCADSLLTSLQQQEYDYDVTKLKMDSLMAAPVSKFYRSGIVKDIEIISANYLMDNIDRSFEIWQTSPWAKNLNFDEFCEALLPYKVMELQPLDNWKEYLAGRYSYGVEDLDCCDLYRHSAIKACEIINQNLKDTIKPDIRGYEYPVVLADFNVKPKLPFGNCGYFADIATAVMRSEGIPVLKDFIPMWSFRPLGHEWNIVMNNEGRWVQFGGALSNPGVEEKIHERMSKVYRVTYSHNDRLLSLLATDVFIPTLFRSPFFKDVTNDYIPTKTLTISIPEIKEKVAYLALPNVGEWEPIDFCFVDGKTAMFENIGVGSVYTVISFDKNGKYSLLSEPFLFNKEGEMLYFTPDEENRETVVLKRKYPALPHVSDAAIRSIGGEFQASNDANFKSYTLIHKIEDAYPTGHCVSVADSIPEFRYWRYTQAVPGTHCNIAELNLLDKNGFNLKGKIIGTPGSWLNPPTATINEVFDNDLLTIFEAPVDHGAWVGVDFGEPVKVDKIIYTGRGDGNSIETGDTYELFYFKNRKWNSLGLANGNGYELRYDNVPKNSLLLLKDLTRGKEERIFTYKDGEQVWW